MHDLPDGLTNDLRNFRGALTGERASRTQHIDLGADEEAYGDKEFDRALSDTESSTVPDTTVSAHTMDQNQAHHKQHPEIEKHGADAAPATVSQNDSHSKNTNAVDPQPKSMYNLAGDPEVKDLDPAAARLAKDLTPLSLEDFYTLLGVSTPTSPLDALVKLAHPQGLVSQIHKQMRYENRKFKSFDWLTYILLTLQITLSAIFIILGSLRNVDTHIAIPVLGAIATIVSGALALMKGQGLPNRLRVTRDGLRDVLFEAEELYWDIRSGRTILYKDVKKLREDYLRVVEAARQHHPDAWSGTTDAIAQGTTGKQGGGKSGNL